MRTAVSKAFKSFSTKFEGYLTYMYGDVKNLVTTGMGNLIDPISTARNLPWVNSDGSAASFQQITDAWNAVKARTDLASKGGKAYESVTSIRLTEAGIDQLIQSRLASNEKTLRGTYPDYDSWPADAQLALLSMAWAMGPAFKFPSFTKAIKKSPPDFTTAAAQCKMDETGNAGLKPRNVANKKLFLNAAAVLANGANPDTLYYPDDVPVGTTTHAPASTTTHARTTTAAPEQTTTHEAAAHETTQAPEQGTTEAPAGAAAPSKSTTYPPRAPRPHLLRPPRIARRRRKRQDTPRPRRPGARPPRRPALRRSQPVRSPSRSIPPTQRRSFPIRSRSQATRS